MRRRWRRLSLYYHLGKVRLIQENGRGISRNLESRLQKVAKTENGVVVVVVREMVSTSASFSDSKGCMRDVYQ